MGIKRGPDAYALTDDSENRDLQVAPADLRQDDTGSITFSPEESKRIIEQAANRGGLVSNVLDPSGDVA